MGCHTWCFRRATQKECNRLKVEETGYLLDEIKFWDKCVNGRFEDITIEEINYLVHRDEDLTKLSKSDYAKRVYELLYDEEYLNFKGTASQNLEHFTSVPKEKWVEGAAEDNDRFARTYGYENFDAMLEHTREMSMMSFDDFCQCRYEQYSKLLMNWDMENPNVLTDKDILKENKYYNLENGGLVRVYNGKLYTDLYEPHDIFRIYDYNFPTLFSADECIRSVNEWKEKFQQPLLTDEEIERINKFFNDNGEDCFIEFG